MDKKNKKISSEMERLIEKFAFNKFSKKHQNCLKRAEEGLHSLFSIHEDMLLSGAT